MPRLLVVERDTARRDALLFLLSQAGYDVVLARSAGEVEQASGADLTIIGHADLKLLEELPRTDNKLAVRLLALVDPGDCAGILNCLRAGVAGVFSRQRTNDDILAKIRSLIESAISIELRSQGSASLPHKPRPTDDYHQSDLLEAFQSACDDIGRLQESYENELTHTARLRRP